MRQFDDFPALDDDLDYTPSLWGSDDIDPDPGYDAGPELIDIPTGGLDPHDSSTTQGMLTACGVREWYAR